MIATATERTTATVRARARLRATTPDSYRWWRHVLLVAVFTLVGLLFTASRLGEGSPAGYAFFAAVLVLLNFGEYASHRWNMHQLRWPWAVYYRHVVEHHAFFTYEDMDVDDIEDLRWVLFPPWALPLLIVTVLPLFLALWLLAPPGWAWLYLLAVVLYYGLYEVVHALAHLPAEHPIGGHPAVRALTYHHRVHHDPALMDRWNFNFAVPLFDWLFGTTHQADRDYP